MKRLFRDTKSCVIVVQYQLVDLDVGSERDFHWAIAVADDPKTVARWPSCTYQVYNTASAGENRQEWQLRVDRAAVLGSISEWCGGVVIGKIKKSQLNELDTAIFAHTPVPKSDGWNCRDWVMEGIQLISDKELTSVRDSPGFRARLLHGLRQANEDSKKAISKGGAAVVHLELGMALLDSDMI